MKITPFQQALKNELTRLEQFTQPRHENHNLVLFCAGRPTKQRHFLLQFFRLSFHI